MVTFRTGEVCKYLNLPRKTLDDWCRKGVVTCEGNGLGTGHQRRFNLVQLCALAYAIRFLGITKELELAKGMMEYITSHSEKELLAKFKKGYIYMLPIPKMQLVKGLTFEGKEFYDLEDMYYTTMRYFEHLEASWSVARNN